MNQNQRRDPRIENRYTYWNVAYIFMIIFTVLSSFAFLLPLAWMIPMTIMTHRARDEVGTPDEQPHVILGICAVFFSGVIPGILILLATANFVPKDYHSDYSND